jgi:hypothetical protein
VVGAEVLLIVVDALATVYGSAEPLLSKSTPPLIATTPLAEGVHRTFLNTMLIGTAVLSLPSQSATEAGLATLVWYE